MSKQSSPTEFDIESSAEASMSLIQETMDRFLASADVETVYAEPVQHGDSIIIPAAEVLCGMGFGAGAGYGKSQEAGETDQGAGGGGGGGGGGYTLSRPVAVIIASPQGVRVEPVVDVTKIGLAALTAAGFMLSVLARMSRRSSA